MSAHIFGSTRSLSERVWIHAYQDRKRVCIHAYMHTKRLSAPMCIHFSMCIFHEREGGRERERERGREGGESEEISRTVETWRGLSQSIFSNCACAWSGLSRSEARSSEARSSEERSSETSGFSSSEARLRHAASSCITDDTQHSASPHPTHAVTHSPSRQISIFFARLFDPNFSRVETFTFFFVYVIIF